MCRETKVAVSRCSPKLSRIEAALQCCLQYLLVSSNSYTNSIPQCRLIAIGESILSPRTAAAVCDVTDHTAIPWTGSRPLRVASQRLFLRTYPHHHLPVQPTQRASPAWAFPPLSTYPSVSVAAYRSRSCDSPLTPVFSRCSRPRHRVPEGDGRRRERAPADGRLQRPEHAPQRLTSPQLRAVCQL